MTRSNSESRRDRNRIRRPRESISIGTGAARKSRFVDRRAEYAARHAACCQYLLLVASASKAAAIVSAIVMQAIVLFVIGLGFILVILRLARRRRLSARYSMGWLGLGLLLVVAATLLPFVGRIGRLASISPTAALLGLTSLVLLAITVQLSISVSHLQANLRTVIEEQALLRGELEEARRALRP